MLVRSAIDGRIATAGPAEPQTGRVTLPTSLKRDPVSSRIALLQRLSAGRIYALGQRSGTLRRAQARSGRPFRLDLTQRVVVKALVSRHAGRSGPRGAALARHLSYLGRSGSGVEGAPAEFFNSASGGLKVREVVRAWAEDRHHFRFIVSPEHGDRIADLESYVRAAMSRVAADLEEPALEWLAACHFDTDRPHAHVLVRGRRADGRDLVIPRAYIAYGFRARAQETAQEMLGDLSRLDAERRIWRETQADRFTGFDRRLLAAADPERRVTDALGRGDAWGSLTRARLRHLEALGLARREGGLFRLDQRLEAKLRGLQLRRDVIRTLNQRRLEGARMVQELGAERVRGVVVRSGSHDELGAAPFVIVRDRQGLEHYARLSIGAALPRAGRAVELAPTGRGARVLSLGRGRERLQI